MKRLVCRVIGHVWEFGWQGNGNMDRRECARCHLVMRRRPETVADRLAMLNRRAKG